MLSKILLSAFAGVAVIAIVGASQDPTFEYPAAKHVGFDLPKADFSVAAQTEKISVSFRDASVREVLDWLKNQGVNFIIGDDQVNKDGKININVVNQPVDKLMKALAAAWEGHWEKSGDMWVFHKGRDVFGEVRSDSNLVFDGPAVSLTSPSKSFDEPKLFTRGNGDTLLLDGQKGDNNLDQLSKAHKEMLDKTLQKIRNMKDTDDPRAWEEFSKAWEKWAQDYEKNFREFERTLRDKNFNFKMDDRAMLDMQKKAEEMAKSGQNMRFKFDQNSKGYSFDGKDLKPLDEKQIKELTKHAEEMAKAGQNMRFKFDPNSKGFSFDGKDFKPLDEKQIEELTKHAEEMAREAEKMRIDAMKEGRTARDQAAKARASARSQARNGGRTIYRRGPETSARSSAHNLKAIYDSLTPAQTQKLEKLGYISYHDLNSNQRAMLGVITDETWTITYKTDKVNFTIKSDH